MKITRPLEEKLSEMTPADVKKDIAVYTEKVKYLPVFLKQTIDYIYIRFLTTM